MYRHEQFHPGDPITARLMNALGAEVARLGRIGTIPPLYLRDDVGGPNLGIDLPSMRLALTGTGGIPARSGTTLGSATATSQNINNGILSGGETVTVYNWAGTAVGANKYILIYQVSGAWLAVAEDCP